MMERCVCIPDEYLSQSTIGCNIFLNKWHVHGSLAFFVFLCIFPLYNEVCMILDIHIYSRTLLIKLRLSIQQKITNQDGSTDMRQCIYPCLNKGIYLPALNGAHIHATHTSSREGSI